MQDPGQANNQNVGAAPMPAPTTAGPTSSSAQPATMQINIYRTMGYTVFAKQISGTLTLQSGLVSFVATDPTANFSLASTDVKSIWVGGGAITIYPNGGKGINLTVADRQSAQKTALIGILLTYWYAIYKLGKQEKALDQGMWVDAFKRAGFTVRNMGLGNSMKWTAIILGILLFVPILLIVLGSIISQ